MYGMKMARTGLSLRGSQQHSIFYTKRNCFAGFSLLAIFFLLSFSGCTNLFAGVSQIGNSAPTANSTGQQATPTQDPLQAARNRAAQLMDGMSLDQKLGQLIVVEYLGNDYQNSGLQYMVTQQYVGGVLYQTVNNNFDPPDDTVDGLAAFSAQIQQDTKIPLLIGTDQEGGQVNRLQPFHGDLPSAANMAAMGNSTSVFQQGAQAAQWMHQLGMNADLAPVVDVQSVDQPLLQDRLFGSTPQAVETYAGAYLDGLQQNGVIGTLKHFPGLGSLPEGADPHFELPTVDRSMSDLENIDLAPYKAMIEKNHPAMIMDTDVITTAIDPNLPAELSPKAIDGLLRGQLGYNGVVITDGLYMQGITNNWSIDQAALLAIEAGNDLIEGPYKVEQVAAILTTLKQALQAGTLTQARIDQSVERILATKIQYGIIK
jgi:beta-N-acetylhexosaminidase